MLPFIKLTFVILLFSTSQLRIAIVVVIIAVDSAFNNTHKDFIHKALHYFA